MIEDIFTYFSSRTYPGRLIVIGETGTEERFFAYGIMGRSASSQNRWFRADGPSISTEPYDTTPLVDPSLLIYRPVAKWGNCTIVTNGDQTETILKEQDFRKALDSRSYEPDAPSFTPRISALLEPTSYQMSILRKMPEDDRCDRWYGRFAWTQGEGALLHTYEDNGNPLPSFQGPARTFRYQGSFDSFPLLLWQALNPAWKISLVVRSIDTGKQIIYNRHGGTAHA